MPKASREELEKAISILHQYLPDGVSLEFHYSIVILTDHRNRGENHRGDTISITDTLFDHEI